jgi:hypothetical protein
MVSTNSSWIPLAGLGLVTGLAGGFLGAILLIDRVRPSRESAPSPSQANDESVAVLRDLAGEVRRLREAIELGASSRTQEPGSERAPMDPAGTERLEHSIERLAEVLANPGSAPSRRSVGASPRETTVQPKATDRLIAVIQARDPKPYFFWTVEQVVDEFGTPDWMMAETKGYLRLYYKVSENNVLGFFFDDHLLYSIEYPRN